MSNKEDEGKNGQTPSGDEDYLSELDLGTLFDGFTPDTTSGTGKPEKCAPEIILDGSPAELGVDFGSDFILEPNVERPADLDPDSEFELTLDGNDLYQDTTPQEKPLTNDEYLDAMKYIWGLAERLDEVGRNLEKATELLIRSHGYEDLIKAAGIEISEKEKGSNTISTNSSNLSLRIHHVDYDEMLGYALDMAEVKIRGKDRQEGRPYSFREKTGVVDRLQMIGTAAQRLFLGKGQLTFNELEALRRIPTDLEIASEVLTAANKSSKIAVENQIEIQSFAADAKFLNSSKEALADDAKILLDYNTRYSELTPKTPMEWRKFKEERYPLANDLAAKSNRFVKTTSSTFAERAGKTPGTVALEKETGHSASLEMARPKTWEERTPLGKLAYILTGECFKDTGPCQER